MKRVPQQPTTTSGGESELAGPADHNAPGDLLWLTGVIALLPLPLVLASSFISLTGDGTLFILGQSSRLVGMFALLLVLFGLYAQQAKRAGRFGAVAFSAALFGTLLAAGISWFNAFAAPYLYDATPATIGRATGALEFGIVASNVAFAAGWLLFAVSILRARVLPKWPAVFLLVFSVVSFFPSFVDPENVVRAPTRLDEPVPVLFAVAWMGVLLMWKRAPRTGGSSGEYAARVK